MHHYIACLRRAQALAATPPTRYVGGRSLLDMRRFAAPGFVALGLAASAGAQDSHREHGAHEHGSGALNVVFEANELTIELRMPGVNVVGFEHAPGNEADHGAIDKALAIFRDAARLFVTDSKADCKVEHVEANIGPPGDDHDDHGDEKTHDEDGEQGHTELHAEYHFDCAAPQHLKRLEVKAFEHFIDVDALSAQVVTDTYQGAIELKPGRAVLPLGGS